MQKKKKLEEVIQSHHASVSQLQYGDNNTLLSAMLVDENVVIGMCFFKLCVINVFKYTFSKVFYRCTSLYTNDIVLKNWMKNEFSPIYCLISSLKVLYELVSCKIKYAVGT